MTYQNIGVDPLSPIIGAEVSGVDISKPLDKDVLEEVNRALLDHQVIFFRDQEMSLERHKAFGRNFGSLHIHPTAAKIDGHPEILIIHADENSKAVAGMKWHSDVSCDLEPPMGSILHLHQIPKVGGDTMFSNMETAYDTLSDEMKEKIKDKKAVHSSLGAEAFVKKYKEMEGNGNLDEYSNIHPIVRVHPETGKKILYVNSMYTKQIIDMDKEESDKILKELFLHQERLDFTCRFKWTENAVAIWDNRSTQHQGLTDFFPNRGLGFERVMDRIAIEGDHPQ